MKKKTVSRLFVSMVLFLSVLGAAFASGEDDLFFSGDSIFDEEPVASETSSDADLFGGDQLFEEATETDLSLTDLLLSDEDGITIGGSYSFVMDPYWYKVLDSGIDSSIDFSSELDATFYFDARPDTDIRIYGEADLEYASGTATVTLMELFGDFDIGDQVFFRVGKQTITWGVGYFFSPADVLNLDDIDILDVDADIEGPVAIKANMPLGSDNLYAYMVFSEDDSSAPGWAVNYEKVVSQTEFGFGGYYQEDDDPAAIFTVSSGIDEVTLFGEAVTRFDGSDPYFQGTVGAMRSWTDDDSDFGITIAGQYYYDGSADYVHKAATTLSATFTDELSASLLWYGILDGNYGLVMPSITWDPVDYVSVSFSVGYLYGGMNISTLTSIGSNDTLIAYLTFTLGETDF
jgi:hypothetical protein